MEPWERQSETPAKWAKVRNAKDRDSRRAALDDMDLAKRLEPLFSAGVEEHDALAEIEKTAEAHKAILSETNKKLRLLGSFRPTTQREAEKVETQRDELKEVVVVANKAIAAGDAAGNPRAGLETYFSEMFGEPALEHSGRLGSWLPPQRTAAAAAAIGVSLWKANDWRRVTPERASEEKPQQRYRSF